MKSVALVTAREARGLDEDMPFLEASMRAAGVHLHVVDWDDRLAPWSTFDIALLRSTWDYIDRLPEFLAWVDSTARVTKLLNPPHVVRWNTDKHYLSDLARSGIPVVQSIFIEPGESAEEGIAAFLAKHHCAEFVVKPSVGAGSRDTQRHVRTQTAPAVAQASRLLDARRSVLLQPYLSNIDINGETALIYIAGRFSHAICKGPLLPPGSTASPAVGLFAPERITPREPRKDELRVAEQVISALRGGQWGSPAFQLSPTPLLYARIDLIRNDAGAPTLLELELTEPSLFFAYGAGSAERFTSAVVELLNG